MALTRYDYFYDAQVRRYLMQVVRAFSGFQYMTGARGNIPGELRVVPCTTSKRNRQVAAIQRNMSENTLLSVPMISVDITAFEPDRERMQNISHVESVQVTERARDAVTGEYTDMRGNSATIERMMPRPYMLTVQVDIWTATMDQKFQLLEQIDTIIFPGFDIQNSDNALDWSALTTATMESQSYSSISVPIGTENEIDVASIVLKIPMWLSPPARVHRQRLIHQIITNVSEGEKDAEGAIIPTNHLMRVVHTPGNHCLRVDKGQLTLLGGESGNMDSTGALHSWSDLLAQYNSEIKPGETQVFLRRTLGEDTSADVAGVVFPTGEENVLAWQPDIDTLPANTLEAVVGIIDPLRSIPGEGSMLPAAEGQRYLIISDIAGFPDHSPPSGSPQTVWSGIQARAGSVIQYQNGRWMVSFNPLDHQQTEYITNRNTGRQLVWSVDQQEWVMALDGVYAAGYWRLGTI